MALSVRDRKMLWGRSASLCAMCRTPLIRESELGGSTIIGEEAHIVAREEDGPRGQSALTVAQRDYYSNILLLCPTHHTIIDSEPTGPRDYPTETLLEIKQSHEQWVIENNKVDQSSQRAEEQWGRIVDEFASRMRWDNWNEEIGCILEPGAGPYLTHDVHARLTEIPRWVLSRIWPPSHQHLRALIEGVATAINDLLFIFDRDREDCPYRNNAYSLVKSYKIRDYDPPLYNSLLADYKYRVDLLYDLVLEVTRYSNAICDEIRRKLDPQYRFNEGAVLLHNGPTISMTHEVLRPEFNADDFRNGRQPYIDLSTFKKDRFSRDSHLSDSSGEDYKDR